MSAVSRADNFTQIPFTAENLDRFVVRTAIFEAIKEHLPDFKGKLLDMGCGRMPYKDFLFGHGQIKEYVGLDIDGAIQYDSNLKPDFTWDGFTMPFLDETFDTIFATEVLEHCPFPEVTLKEAYRVLKPGGCLFFTTPFFWNLHEVPHDEYRYTPFSLKRHLSNAGYMDITIKASGGWHASLAQMLGLWVRRSPMSSKKRRYLSMLFRPIIKRLLKMGSKEKVDFNQGPMITTLYGTALK